MLKRSYHVQTRYEISDKEIQNAEQAVLAFDHLLRRIELLDSHLDKLHVSFQGNTQVPPEQIWQARTTFKGYRDQSQTQLDAVKQSAFQCVTITRSFMSDTQVEKMMSSFNLSIEDVTKQFDRFSNLFQNLQAPDFIDNCVKGIEAINKEMAQLKQIIERIQKYIETDILAKSWMDNAGNLKLQLDEKVPFEKQLLDVQKQKLDGNQAIDIQEQVKK